MRLGPGKCKSLQDLATPRRLIRAAELLRETTRGTHEIATALGYRAPTDLSKAVQAAVPSKFDGIQSYLREADSCDKHD